MRRIVADYLEPRLCPDAVMVGLGEVSIWDLLAGGHLELLPSCAGY
jgi:hypothetical protein